MGIIIADDRKKKKRQSKEGRESEEREKAGGRGGDAEGGKKRTARKVAAAVSSSKSTFIHSTRGGFLDYAGIRNFSGSLSDSAWESPSKLMLPSHAISGPFKLLDFSRLLFPPPSSRPPKDGEGYLLHLPRDPREQLTGSARSSPRAHGRRKVVKINIPARERERCERRKIWQCDKV